MSDQPNPCWGSTLDDFLKEEGIYEAAKTTAVLRVVAWQLAQESVRNPDGIREESRLESRWNPEWPTPERTADGDRRGDGMRG